MYQLQGLDLRAVGRSAYDLIVMDYSANGDEESQYSRSDINGLKQGSGDNKVVLAYLSIGEAESYRYYWQERWRPGAPEWLDASNPNWQNNFKVRYWDEGWQQIVFGYVDRLLEAGFDGAYLDVVDAYEHFADQGRSTSAQEMVDFVAAIADYARARDQDFLILPQNAPELAALVPGYVNIVDGIGQEDIYFGYEGDDERTPQHVTREMEDYLDLYLNAGKLVLTVDYAHARSNVEDAYESSRSRGYVPFVTVRDLDRLIVNPGHEPD